jgi:hypothetical protein
MVRESKHPDAQWLSSLLPADAAMSWQREVVLLRGGDDRRAFFFAGKLTFDN